MNDIITKRAKYVSRYNLIGYVATFSALAFASTTFLRIPNFLSGGYFNVGDTFVMIAALMFGPGVGFLVGLIGPAAADALGYPQFIPATAIIKSLEGFLVGWIGYRSMGVSVYRCLASLFIGALVIVIGYFCFEAYFYPYLAKYSAFFDATNFAQAVAELIPNCLQGLISALLAFGIWKLFGLQRKDG